MVDKKDETEEKKDISVKGVSRDIYAKVLRLAKETGKTLGRSDK
jgi:hypothetical protein